MDLVVLADGLGLFILTVDIGGRGNIFVVNTYKSKTLDKGLVLNSEKLQSSWLHRNWTSWGVPLCKNTLVFA